MSRKAIFEGLIIDEKDNIVTTAYVGEEPCYVVDDDGFYRHIPSEYVDRQVLDRMAEMIQGHEGVISEQVAKMLGQEDIFTLALIENQLKNMDSQFQRIIETGIPEEGIAYMGMTGFRIKINVHGDVVEMQQPGLIESDDE
ncbi:hypothetical protein AMJ86_01405 [bacterium SM23_57]|jgi:hypothetical protein|nr:MAG: hypothetical protein AMJ86_01405 [bacterium SM23_57]